MRARLGARVLTVGVLCAAGVVGTAAVSWAHHPEVAASTQCGGLVHFTSTAWITSSTAARTNPTIGISYSTDGGSSFTSLPQQAAYHFGADNDYSFSDDFSLSQPLASTVIVRATALAKWANGASAGSYRQTPALTVEGCPAKPAATISDVDCSAGGSVTVRLTNDGDFPATFTISGTDADGAITVNGHGSMTRTVTPAEDSNATYAVSADGMSTVTKSVHRDCVQPAPVATLSHDCDGIHVVLANRYGSQEAIFTITTSDGSTEQVTVAAGATSTRLFPVDEGATRTVTVTSPGMTDASDTFTCHCAPDLPTPPVGSGPGDGGGQQVDQGGSPTDTSGAPTTPSHPSTSGTTTSGSSVLGVSKSQSRRSITPQVRSASNASTERQLPFTGTNTVDLLTAGLLSLLLGAALMSAGRRRGDAA